MTSDPMRCDDRGKSFVDANALYQHRKFRHPAEPFPKSRALIADAIEAAIFDTFDPTEGPSRIEKLLEEPR